MSHLCKQFYDERLHGIFFAKYIFFGSLLKTLTFKTHFTNPKHKLMATVCVCVCVSVCMCHCKTPKGHIANFGVQWHNFTFFLSVLLILSFKTIFSFFWVPPLWISLFWIMGKLGGEGLWMWSLLLVTSDIWRMKPDTNQVTDGTWHTWLQKKSYKLCKGA